MNMTLQKNRIYIPLLLFLLTFAVSGYFSTIGIDPHHDGIMFKPALDVANGKMLFKDTFSMFNVLSLLIQGAALLIFGKYLITIKLCNAFFYGLISVLVYSIFKRFLPRSVVVATVILWIFSAPYFLWTFLAWSTVYALFFLLASLYFLILSIEKKDKKAFILLSGICAAFTFWTRQNIGIVLCLMFMAFFFYEGILRAVSLKESIRRSLLFLSGLFVISSVIILWLLTNGALNDWWLQSFVHPHLWSIPVTQNYTFQLILQNLFPVTYSQSPVSLWFLMPIITLYVFLKYVIVSLYSPKSVSARTVLACIFISIAAWTEYYPIVCYRHVYWGATVMFGTFALFVYHLAKDISGPFTKKSTLITNCLTILFLLIVFYPEVSYRITEGIKKSQAQYTVLTAPSVLQGMRVTENEADYYTRMASEISSFLDNNPGKNVINLTMDALYLTFDQRIQNIHPAYVNLMFLNSDVYPAYWRTYETYWQKNQPLIITYGEFVPPGYCKDIQIPEMYGTYLVKPC
ncbi:MAG: hypothetical protein UW37_C0008G0023 [Candidatus Gottesmanbacteria bacterium GW2011_GWA2_44_17]|uniref:Glycosyltransferase RgtA/B/C/D-like domain-containing protein n=3 Tax=Candidatus Gottesmaniibacteriota TaxID=1752720 RepID=A0A0G1LMR3_9BACT|nr:MAG: hypothetical protein UV63_C0032G0014 [Microgenomates group bacterium GW2011_GWC1_43_11]KKT36517.1 MAG: hypothetical protein UW22_C0037G0015 [Candidatus Gottesmanbacteria bacterium GW2011_GWB1_44_11c]KKT47423.1 MAG: hypothetical protein UW37_C0008G0023 [Candidatus Gottesmanbacteria bacterium GW2011_GWA2_44_17]KKT61129.1 MAG: hypothetical protein UW52_C0010G0024 [Candidatus Gottesmanbacteria bacterium GW2011_GWA1_44_24b]HCM82096.1 hypothetical protein [Patescibacteria group bacterium]